MSEERILSDDELAAAEALTGMMMSIEALKILSADASKHRRIAIDAVYMWPIAEGGYERALDVAMDAASLTTKVEAMLAELQPTLEKLAGREALLRRERNGSTVN